MYIYYLWYDEWLFVDIDEIGYRYMNDLLFDAIRIYKSHSPHDTLRMKLLGELGLLSSSKGERSS